MLKDKLKSLKSAIRIIRLLQKKNKKVVFTNGCFDLLHYGHVKYLEEAKAKADFLVVGLNSDASVRRLKGDNRPLNKQYDRARLIAGLESVDLVVIFNEDTPLRIIRLLKPNILVKGADWNTLDIVGRDCVINNGGRVLTIKYKKGYSTTGLIKQIAKTKFS
ncbi:MAG: D-glycero-beta-D-manno-heptose 1-phosphate adenylyltransferase [Candidatus Omnitrophota bacterium]|nr:D-glycero-beta-D-manno-heptose 1-phosphate adenylyltransferase [Candidatus Omnitrophota bacterium]